jgi:hypothetical protein
MTTEHCQATTAAGSPCKGTRLPDGLLCRAHDPAHREAMQAARARGGRNKAKAPADPNAPQAPDLTTGPKIIRTLDQAAKAMATGAMSAREAAALAALGRLALASLERDQQAQLDRLERLVAEHAPKTAGRRR